MPIRPSRSNAPHAKGGGLGQPGSTVTPLEFELQVALAAPGAPGQWA